MGKALDKLLAGFGKKQESKHTRDCSAIGCQSRVFGFALFCSDCWSKCPSNLKRLIEKHHKPQRRPSKILTKWIDQARSELLYLKTSGHHRPRDGSFMWDEEPTPPAEVDGDLLGVLSVDKGK
jgi:hypothetical protein